MALACKPALGCRRARLTTGGRCRPQRVGEPRLYKKVGGASHEGKADFSQGLCSHACSQVPAWVPALTPLCDGLGCRSVSRECEPNKPLLPHLAVMMFTTAIENKLGHGVKIDFYLYFIYILNMSVSEPFEWLDVFQA